MAYREVEQHDRAFSVFERNEAGVRVVTGIYELVNGSDVSRDEARAWFVGYARDFLGFEPDFSSINYAPINLTDSP